MGRARTRKISWRVRGADSTFLCEPPALGTAGGYRCVPPGFAELRMRWFAACTGSVRTMTVSVRNPQQKLRLDIVMRMEVLSLYADPIRPALARGDSSLGQGCRVFMHPAMSLGDNTHYVSWEHRNCQVANSERCLT